MKKYTEETAKDVIRAAGGKIESLLKEIHIKSGSLGLRRIGAADFLAKSGYFICWIK